MLAISSRLFITAGLIVGLLAGGARAQEASPPRPIETLFQEFLEDPTAKLASIPGPCPAEGTWERALLRRLLELPPEAPEARAIIGAHAYNVEHCVITELDSWFRQALLAPRSVRDASEVAGALWSSGRDENREAIVAAMFAPEVHWEVQEAIAGRMALTNGIGTTGFLRLVGEGYRRFGGPPPTNQTMLSLRFVGNDARGLQAKRELLASWKAVPAGPGSQALLQLMINDAISSSQVDGRSADAWVREVGSLLEQIHSGRITVPQEVRAEAQRRLEWFRAYSESR